MNSSHPDISIIVPVLKITNTIRSELLPALQKQSEQSFELIVLPNKKSDNDTKLLKKYPFLRIYETKSITKPAEKRDIGAKKANGAILAFIDDDAYPAETWLEMAKLVFATKLHDKKLLAVCGPGILPPQSGFFERVFDAVLCTFAGSGGFAYRFTPKKARSVDDYPSMNFLVQKEAFFQAGGFNSNYWPGEDSKLCEQLVYQQNGIIYYDPRILVYHHRRNSLKHFLKQHGNYGYHRGAFFVHGDRNSRRLSYLIPSMFLTYLLLILRTFIHSDGALNPLSLWLIPLWIYIFILCEVIVETLIKTKHLGIAAASPVVLFLTHVVYGFRFLQGAVVSFVRKGNIY